MATFEVFIYDFNSHDIHGPLAMFEMGFIPRKGETIYLNGFTEPSSPLEVVKVEYFLSPESKEVHLTVRNIK